MSLSLYSLAVSCLVCLYSLIVHTASLALHTVIMPFLFCEFVTSAAVRGERLGMPVDCRSGILVTVVTSVTKVFKCVGLHVKCLVIFCLIFTEIECVDKLQ